MQNDGRDDLYWDYDEAECWNCGGDGFTYGDCGWDWQCDTYVEGEGCLCKRRCEWCQPVKRDPALEGVLSEALAQGIVPNTLPNNEAQHDEG